MVRNFRTSLSPFRSTTQGRPSVRGKQSGAPRAECRPSIASLPSRLVAHFQGWGAGLVAGVAPAPLRPPALVPLGYLRRDAAGTGDSPDAPWVLASPLCRCLCPAVAG